MHGYNCEKIFQSQDLCLAKVNHKNGEKNDPNWKSYKNL